MTDTRPCTEGPDGGTCDGTDHVRHLVWSCFTATEIGRLRDALAEAIKWIDGADQAGAAHSYCESDAGEGWDCNCGFDKMMDRLHAALKEPTEGEQHD